MSDSYPLSSHQKSLWLFDKLNPKSSSYNEPFIFNLVGDFNINLFKHALIVMIKRHESLRTFFSEINGNPVQTIDKISKSKTYRLKVKTIKEKDVEEIISKEVNKNFNLKKPPLFRISLFKYNKNFLLVFIFHHIIIDNWSMDIFFRELSVIYNNSFLEKNIFTFLRIQYKDYAFSENNNSQFKKEERYWVKNLNNSSMLNLPYDNMPKYPDFNFSADRETFIIKINYLKNGVFCQQNNSSFLFIFSNTFVFLNRITNQKDIVIGAPITMRRNEELKNVMGFFLNILPYRVKINNNKSFPSFLKEINKIHHKNLDNASFPFDSLVDKISPPISYSKTPLINTLFQVINKTEKSFFLKNIKMSEIWKDSSSIHFDLVFSLIVYKNNISLKFSYNKNLFKKKTIVGFVNNFSVLLNSILKEKEKPIKDLEIISDSDKEIFKKINDTKIKYPKDKTINELFEKKVKETPNAIAVGYEDKNMSYAQINRDANKLSRFLQFKKIKKGNILLIFLNSSFDFVLTILAGLKIGAILMPINIAYPKEYIRKIIDDTKPDFILTKSKFLSNFVQSKNKLILLDKEKINIFKQKESNILNLSSSNDPAYIINTSGSTGISNSVLLNHQGIINHAFTKINFIKINRKDIISQSLSISFVASIWQFIAPLIIGGKIHMYSEEIKQNPIELFKRINLDKISIIEISPSMIRNFLNICSQSGIYPKMPKLKNIILTGEEVSTEIVEEFYKKYKINLINAYGQTECSDDTLHFEIRSFVNYNRIPIGVPSNNIQIFILNQDRKLQPVNTIGQLFISGDCLAMGCLNKDKKLFEKHPFLAKQKIYKTGDLAKINNDGLVEYIGREDNQVHIRGNRVELSDIEINLRKNHFVKDCAVVENKNLSDEKIVIAYYTLKRPIKESELIEYLVEKLPVFMIPSYFIFLKKMPLNFNGKINRQALIKRALPEVINENKGKYFQNQNLKRNWQLFGKTYYT